MPSLKAGRISRSRSERGREDDDKRVGLVREAIGPDRTLMIDANQRWDVQEAIDRVRALSTFNLRWIEEPTSPDDVLGHAAIARAVAPVGVATGEHCANRVLFKQLLQAKAISFCQIDSCRLGGVNENLAVILMAAKFGVPVCPHAGGVGLCELVQHLSMFDYIAVSGTLEGRVTEFVDHLHEHFVDPVVIKNARYMPPLAPGTRRRSSRHLARGSVFQWVTHGPTDDAMNCFVHDRSAAVGLCAACQKAVCRECVGRETPRVICRTCLQRGALQGFEYRSEAAIGNWPLIHICTGVDPITMRPRVAKGVIAIGNVAVGAVAMGGLACGLVTLGGASFGLLFALGGLAVGLGLSVGGLAIGSVAVGGAAIGFVYAIGGGAFGPAIIDGRRCDAAAVEFVRQWLGSGLVPPSCR